MQPKPQLGDSPRLQTSEQQATRYLLHGTIVPNSCSPNTVSPNTVGIGFPEGSGSVSIDCDSLLLSLGIPSERGIGALRRRLFAWSASGRGAKKIFVINLYWEGRA
jgi:hypothetical protein